MAVLMQALTCPRTSEWDFSHFSASRADSFFSDVFALIFNAEHEVMQVLGIEQVDPTTDVCKLGKERMQKWMKFSKRMAMTKPR
jgi:hypothetical protein